MKETVSRKTAAKTTAGDKATAGSKTTAASAVDPVSEVPDDFNMIEQEIWDEWICGIFTKTVCEAKNRNQLMKAAEAAEALGLKENRDYFLIKDNCLTELEPEETDDNGIGRTLTCIGFRPLPDDIAHQISRKYQLYR